MRLFVASACVLMALTTMLFVFVPPLPAEQRFWRALRVQAVRRWLSRQARRKEGHHPDTTLANARRNLWWHVVLTLGATALLFHPWIAAHPWRIGAEAFVLCGSVAYFVGSIVQRQKIVARRTVAARVELHYLRQNICILIQPS